MSSSTISARNYGLIGLLVALSFTPLIAAENPEAAAGTSQWEASAELGFIMNRGNTRTDSLNAQLGVEHSRDQWRHRAEAKAQRATEQDTTTAESYELSGRSDYLLDANDYLFGSLRYTSDEFAGYDRRTTEVLGYGHQFLKRDDMTLKGEFGVGARQTEFVNGTNESEGIVRTGLDYQWKITKTSSFSEVLYVEHGSNNTYTESVTALTAKVNNSLAMKVSYTIKNNSDPQPGFKSTDTRTAVTLVYDF